MRLKAINSDEEPLSLETPSCLYPLFNQILIFEIFSNMSLKDMSQDNKKNLSLMNITILYVYFLTPK